MVDVNCSYLLENIGYICSFLDLCSFKHKMMENGKTETNIVQENGKQENILRGKNTYLNHFFSSEYNSGLTGVTKKNAKEY